MTDVYDLMILASAAASHDAEPTLLVPDEADTLPTEADGSAEEN